MKILLISSIFYLFASIKAEAQYFKSVTGKISGGNFTYFRLFATGAVSLILNSTKGDADLYVSQIIETPTYEPDRYCLHSATCGLDVVNIPTNFGRPISIGIYGHPSHEESEFTLELEAFDESSDNRGDPNSRSSSYAESDIHEDLKEEEEYSEDRNFLFTFLLAFIDVFLEIFLL